MCCEAAMKIKIKSGIQRFQKEKKIRNLIWKVNTICIIDA